jgi:hypothetical protein
VGNRPRDIRDDEDRLDTDDASHTEIIRVVAYLRLPRRSGFRERLHEFRGLPDARRRRSCRWLCRLRGEGSVDLLDCAADRLGDGLRQIGSARTSSIGSTSHKPSSASDDCETRRIQSVWVVAMGPAGARDFAVCRQTHHTTNGQPRALPSTSLTPSMKPS